MFIKEYAELGWAKGNDVIIALIFYEYPDEFRYIKKIDDGYIKQ